MFFFFTAEPQIICLNFTMKELKTTFYKMLGSIFFTMKRKKTKSYSFSKWNWLFLKVLPSFSIYLLCVFFFWLVNSVFFLNCLRVSPYFYEFDVASLLWSRGGSKLWHDTVIRNILKANNTYTNNSWEKPLQSLTIRNITALDNDSLRLSSSWFVLRPT